MQTKRDHQETGEYQVDDQQMRRDQAHLWQTKRDQAAHQGIEDRADHQGKEDQADHQGIENQANYQRKGDQVDRQKI